MDREFAAVRLHGAIEAHEIELPLTSETPCSAQHDGVGKGSIEIPALNVETLASTTLTFMFAGLRVQSAQLDRAHIGGCRREQVARIFEQQDQLLLACRRDLETEAQVEARCGVVDRMGQQCTDASLICNGQRAAYRVLKQANAKASALVDRRHRKPCQDDHRDWVVAHAFARAPRSVQAVNLPHGQAEVASDALVINHHIGSGRAAGMGLSCMPDQPRIQSRVAAIKSVQRVRGAQRLWRAWSAHLPAFSPRRAPRKQVLQARVVLRRSVQQ